MKDMVPSRAAGLAQLQTFMPRAGALYAQERNSDYGPGNRSNVSMLSPYLRYRLISEQEVIAATLDRHGLQESEKYIQEVLWRTYWKGWLQLRPAIWQRYLMELEQQRRSFAHSTALADAEAGRTGIEGFDDWAHELANTGYLHNHARMWFASIWIFTLRLPWVLGADFFMRHLLDADPASNTLSWRWVAGLQTAGKTYLASSDNIARYTGGRFAPKGLAMQAEALTEAPVPPPPQPLPELRPYDPKVPALLLVTPEDMSPETFLPGDAKIKRVVVSSDIALLFGDNAHNFVEAAAVETAERLARYFRCPAEHWPTLGSASLITSVQAAKVSQIITPFAPAGPVASALFALQKDLANADLQLAQIRRNWDDHFWPHATKGFFPFKEKLPALLRELGFGL